MRAAVALSQVYPKLNQDLLVVGILLHDCGKLWENSYPKAGFTQTFDMEGIAWSYPQGDGAVLRALDGIDVLAGGRCLGWPIPAQ